LPPPPQAVVHVEPAKVVAPVVVPAVEQVAEQVVEQAVALEEPKKKRIVTKKKE
jgi:hypothetical protein